MPNTEHLSLPVTTSPALTKDEIIAMGFPAFGPGDQLGHRSGRINGHPTKSGVKMIEISAVLTGGISGGPVVNERFQVIGIAHRGGNLEAKQLAVDVSELQKLAEE